MPDLETLLKRLAADLDVADARWAVVGALAVGVRSEPRFTRDIDLAVAVDSDQQAEHLVFSLRDRGYEVVSTTEHESSGRIAMVRLAPTDEEPGAAIVDLLFATSGIENEIVDEADRLEVLPGLRLRVAKTGHLIALKLLSASDDRPHDRGDLRALFAEARATDLETTRIALALISDRGYNRGRDLQAALDEAIATWPIIDEENRGA